MYDMNRRTSQATHPRSQLTWKGLVYPNHQLISTNGVFGIYGADTVTGAPYGSYVIVSREPYIPISLVWSALNLPYERPTTLFDCINECEELWYRMLNHQTMIPTTLDKGGYARTLRDMVRAYEERFNEDH